MHGLLEVEYRRVVRVCSQAEEVFVQESQPAGEVVALGLGGCRLGRSLPQPFSMSYANVMV